jgi:hypothetical protein
MPRYAAQPHGILIVEFARNDVATPQTHGRHSRYNRTGRPKSGLRHAELRKDLTFRKLVQWHSGHAFNDPSQQHRVQIAVLHARPRSPSERLCHHQMSGFLTGFGTVVQRQEGAKARPVLEQVSYGYPSLALPLEIGEMGLDWAIQIQPAHVNEPHDRGCGSHHLCERSEVPDSAIHVGHSALCRP